MEREEIQRKREAHNERIYLAEQEERLVFVIRIIGIIGVPPKPKKILELLRLLQVRMALLFQCRSTTACLCG